MMHCDIKELMVVDAAVGVDAWYGLGNMFSPLKWKRRCPRSDYIAKFQIFNDIHHPPCNYNFARHTLPAASTSHLKMDDFQGLCYAMLVHRSVFVPIISYPSFAISSIIVLLRLRSAVRAGTNQDISTGQIGVAS